MGNVLGKKPSNSRSTSLSRRSPSSSSGPRGLSRISSGLSRLSARVGLRLRNPAGKAAAANARHQLEQHLADVIQARAAASNGGTPRVSFNRLLLRFGTLHEGFAACRTVFKDVVGVEDGELTLEQLRTACERLGYQLDDATLARIFAGTDVDGSRTLNAEEFVATLAILHVLKGPQEGVAVDPAILATWQTAEDAFLAFASSKNGYIEKAELLSVMHEGATDQVRHSASGSGGDPITAIAQRRFAELDKSGSGRVSFLEFLFCLEGWVEEAED